MQGLRRLVVNADDFGFTRDVNRGIIEAHTKGILTATTLMATGDAFDDAVSLARDNAGLDVGCHLVLVGGRSLARKGAELPSSVTSLLEAILLRRIGPYTELRPQVERILAAGIKPLHLDTHKHTHLWPAVLDAVTRLSEEFRIPWVRRPFDLPLDSPVVPRGKRWISSSLRSVRGHFQRKLAAHGCRTTDHFAGFQLTGRFRSQHLADLLRSLPPGLTEFMCHPGVCTDELRGSPTRLKESREEELKALVSPEVRQALVESHIELVSFRALS